MTNLASANHRTTILTAPLGNRQLTIYSNAIKNYATDNFMVIPVPYPQSVQFVDVKDYKSMNSDMRVSFDTYRNYNRGFNGPRTTDTLLPTFYAGEYQHSVANNLEELIKTYKISNGLLDVLKTYYGADHWGFIVCKLLDVPKPNTHETFRDQYNARSKKHIDVYSYGPLAYTHDLYDNHMFVPTRHYGGQKKKEADETTHVHGENGEWCDDWNHQIYAYNCRVPDTIKLSGLDTSTTCLVDFNKIGVTVNPLINFREMFIRGQAKNIDLVLAVNV